MSKETQIAECAVPNRSACLASPSSIRNLDFHRHWTFEIRPCSLRESAMRHEPACRGLADSTISRRAFLETTVAAPRLAVPQLLASRAAARQAGQAPRSAAVIQIWLGGGPSQFETYDPKPEAPAEYRGSFGAISTCLPGVRILRSPAAPCRVAGPRSDSAQRLSQRRRPRRRHVLLRDGQGDAIAQPSTGSITARLRGANSPACPPMSTWDSSR